MNAPVVPLTFYAGIDPGKAGAVAVVDQAGANSSIRAVPVIRASEKKGRTEYDLEGIRDHLEQLRALGPLFVTLEKAQPMPFTFKRKKKEGEAEADTGIGGTIVNYQRGFSMGWVWMLAALRIPYQLVVPQTWQSVMLAGTSGSDTKQKSILACHRLFPGVSLRRTEKSKVLDHNLSDALLLAEFGRRLRLPGSLRIGEAQVPVGGQTRLL